MVQRDFDLTPEQRSFAQQMPAALCILWTEGAESRVLLISQGFCDLTGMSREELVRRYGQSPERLIHEADLPGVQALCQDLCAHPAEECHGVFRIHGPAETWIWVSCDGRCDAGEKRLAYLTFCDVTAWKREQRQQDSLLERILDTTATALFWKDDQRRFLGVNQSFLDYYGFSDAGELLGKTDEEVGWHTDPAPYRDDEWRVLREGASTRRVHGKCLARGENRDIVASKSPLYVDGKIVGLVGSFEDVTLETRQQEEIARLNRQLELKVAEYDMLMEATGVSIAKVRVDEDFTLEWCNEEFYRSTGYSKEEYVSLFNNKMRLYYQNYPGVSARIRAIMEGALKRGETSFKVTLELPSRDGNRWKKGVGTFADYDLATGRPAFVYAVYTDVTDVVNTQEKLRDAELRAEQAKLLAGENQRLKNTIDNVPSGIGVCRLRDGAAENFVVNQYFSQMVYAGAAPGNEIQRMIQLVHPDDAARCHRDIRHFLAGEGALNGIYRFRRRDSQEYFWAHTEGNLVPQPDGASIAYIAYTNIDELKKAELELESSQRVYTEILRAANIVGWEYDPAQRRVIMSVDSFTQRDAAKFGLPQVIEDAPESLVPYIEPRDVPKFLEMYRQVQAGRDASCEVWYKLNSAEQEPRCERITYTVVRDAQGGIFRIYGMGQNITTQKKAEEAYLRELDFLKQLGDDSLVSKGHFNLTRNRVLEYTAVECAVFFPKTEECYDETCRAFLNDPRVQGDRNALSEALDRRNLMRRCREGECHTVFRYRRKNPDRSVAWISVRLNTYVVPGSDEVECFTYAYDITEKVRGDEVMRLISSTAFDYMAILHAPTGQIKFLKEPLEIARLSKEDAARYDACVRMVAEGLADGEERAQFQAVTALKTVLKALKTKKRYTATYRRLDNGKTRCKQIDYAWLDRDAGMILMLRSDVTASYERDRRQMQEIEKARFQADKANEAKSAFLSSMSHDLRTPLNGIIGFTDIALRQPEVEKKQAYLEKIKSSGELLLALVNDTLELSRIESGKYALELENVDSRELGMAVVTALRPAAELKGVRLLADTGSFPEETVRVDRLKIQKVLLNLLSNAIKFTPSGGSVRVDIGLLNPPVNGCNHRMIVEDTGIGMSPGFLEKMYEPFSQERRNENAGATGTGLGLSIVWRIVTLMGGKIAVQSEVGKGTRFTVDLPIQTASPAEDARQKPHRAASLTGRRVLLCEDNYINQEIAVLVLGERKIQVDTAENGAEGLRKFTESPPGTYDAILMDVRMPVMDGCEAARAIRRLNRADAKTVPIVAMTADAFEEDIRRCVESGMNRHLAKPLRPDDLYRALEELLAGNS